MSTEKRVTHMKKLHLSFLGALALALGAVLPAHADVISYNVTTTWYEPETQPVNSVFVGSFDYDATTHAVTNLKGQLSESMVGSIGYVYGNVPGAEDDSNWLSLTNQLPNGDASHQYEWHDAVKGGTFATTFKNTDSLTFATSVTISGKTYTGDGWSPQGGIAVKWKYAGYPTVAYEDGPDNASALIFVPDNLSAANTTSNPLSLAWNESTHTGSLGLAYTAYADNAPGGAMGSVGMTGTSAYAYGHIGTMQGVPYSEVITAAPVPEPSTIVLAGVALAAAVGFRCGRRRLLGISRWRGHKGK
jgi:hypothetical protein